jgi:hypothetical protein
MCSISTLALTKLEAFDPRKSRIAELRFFGGLSLEETGHVLDISLATVERDWQGARCVALQDALGDNHDRSMTPERMAEIDRVWHAVLARPEAARATALTELCGSDRESSR